MIAYDAEIIRPSDRATRLSPHPASDKDAVFHRSQGRYTCDCIRAILFARASRGLRTRGLCRCPPHSRRRHRAGCQRHLSVTTNRKSAWHLNKAPPAINLLARR